MNADELLARRRFAILSLVRLSGAAFLTVGLLSVADKLTIPRELGFALVAAGFVNFLFLPRHLARKWKSPRP